MFPGSNRGKGRGSLMKSLLDSQSLKSSSSGDGDQDTKLSPSKSSSSVPIVGDSGVDTSSATSSGQKLQDTTSSGSYKPRPSTSGSGSGRGLLLSSVKSYSDEQSIHSTTASTSSNSGKGRGKLISKLLESEIKQSQKEIEKTSQIEEITKNVEEFQLAEESSSSHADVEEIEVKELEPVIRKGEFGTPVNVSTNYLRLKSIPNKGIFEYEVRFTPSVDSKNQRNYYLNEHKNIIGNTKTFDGVTLYLPIKLSNNITQLQSINQNTNDIINIKIIYKRKKSLNECIHFYNVLFDRIMKTLNYVRFERKQYDPTSPKIIPQHKLEIWPGYITAVDEYEDGIMLCCDVSHRLLCQKTVLEILTEIYCSNNQTFRDNAKKSLLGSIVLTRYNNKTYRIDDIDFNSNPLSKFKMADGSEITYMDYYKQQYNINLFDKSQPLLISIKQRRISGKEIPEELIFCLIPEICYLTGLRDELRQDYRVMKDIATFTRVTPNQRLSALQKFCDNIHNCNEAYNILKNWGLELYDKPEKLLGRQLPEEDIYFAKQKFSAGIGASFARHATNNELLEIIHIQNWLLIHTRNTSNAAKSLLDHIQRVAKPMGIQINRPNICVIDNDRTDTYINALRQNLKSTTQIVVLICPTSRDDRYAAIKKICCAEMPIPSQVINAKTLSNDQKNRSIVQKIVLQMNCKLGGTLWSVRIPLQNLMICGIDAYHDAKQKGNSVAAFVASLNSSFTRWFSKSVVQNNREEIVNGLCASFKSALEAYEKTNNCLPDRIMIFRDGVGDGQLKVCSEYEIPQFEEACRMHRKNYEPKFTFVVVQKRINTRIFAESGREGYKNPDPGFILDHTITRRYLYDFFLISQLVREGTVTPTHYIVVKDSSQFKPDIIQRVAYKLCFLYYNWPGTVRVPACCQYAHKLAYLIGQNVKRSASDSLADKLYYL